jgi:hypothetical protein
LSPFRWGEREEPGCRARENDPSILAVTGDGPGHERRGIGNLRARREEEKGRHEEGMKLEMGRFGRDSMEIGNLDKSQ